MCWLKRGIWKAGIAIAGMLLVLMMWVPVSAVGAYERASGLAGPGKATVQATPTEDTTVTALNKEKLVQEVQQLKSQTQTQNDWFFNNSAALIAALSAIAVAFFGLYQWRGNRNDERKKEKEAQDKDLKAQAEERFKTAVAALGDEKEGVQVGGAILLRSFLNKDDKKSYERYYTQIFDLAVANLRLPRTPPISEDPDGMPQLSEDLEATLPLTTLRQVLVVVFKEAFPLARDTLQEHDPKTQFHFQSLDATSVQLDNAYLSKADLKHAWMPQASLRKANIREAHLQGADLTGAHLREAHLQGADLTKTNLREADLTGAHLNGAHLIKAHLQGADLSIAYLTAADLRGADLRGADLRGADFNQADLSDADLTSADLRGANLSVTNLTKADLRGADLRGADLHWTKLENVLSLANANLRLVKELTKEQLEACKAKDAIIDEDTTISPGQSPVSPPSPSQSNDAQAPSAPHAQGSILTPDIGGVVPLPLNKVQSREGIPPLEG
jgi:uncharacterized protein YjbI with pentapeptide repeats